MNGDGHPDPVPLGPDSVLGRLAADWRIGLTGLSAGLLQLMHPGAVRADRPVGAPDRGVDHRSRR